MKELIGLIGGQGVGKDTVAGLLVERHRYHRVAFADPVREMALAIDPWINYDPGNGSTAHIRLSQLQRICGWDKAKRDFPEVRRLLQAIGTEGVRTIIGPDTWTELAFRRILSTGADRVVLTDVRFPNEAQAIIDHGGSIVRVTRKNAPQTVNPGHASETQVVAIEADHTIINDGTLTELELAVTEFEQGEKVTRCGATI